MRSKFTSGGTKKLKLDYDKYEIPDKNNLYGTIDSNTSKLDVAIAFNSIEWSVRNKIIIIICLFFFSTCGQAQPTRDIYADKGKNS